MKKVELISGNLLDFPSHCETDPDKYLGINNIAHSCNCQNVMGGGIAKQIKNRYPQAHEADVKFICDEYDETFGLGIKSLKLSIVADGQFKHPLGNYSKAVIESKFLPNNKGTIYNLYTQAGIGTDERQVHYEKFWQALKNMQEDLLFIQHETGEPQVLGLPYGISCGLAGGNWNIIEAMINDIFADSLIKTFIVKYDNLGKDSPADWQESAFEKIIVRRNTLWELHE